MSMAEDIENLYDDDYEDTDDSIFKDYLLGVLFWETKDRVKINVSQMTESHIKNCMRLKHKNKDNWDIVFQNELNKRTK
jgi:hypothetical protein